MDIKKSKNEIGISSEEIIDAMNDGVCVSEENGTILKVNKAFSQAHGYERPDELSGRSIFEFIAEIDRSKIVKQFNFSNEKGESEIKNLIVKQIRKDGSEFPAVINVSRIRKENNNVFNIAIIRDITDAAKIEDDLRQSKAILEEAQRLTRIGSWSWDIKEDRLSWSKTLCELNGWNPDKPLPGYNELEQFYTKESWQSLQAAVKRAIETGEPYELELEMKQKKNNIHWTLARGEVSFDDKNKVKRLLGTVQDITDRKKARDIIKASLKEKELLLKEMHHRIKNNLFIITSLLAIQEDTIKDDESKIVFQNARNRIKTMALIHEKLYKSDNFKKIEFGAFIKELTSYIYDSYRKNKISFIIDVHEVFIEMEKAVPCALIVNEIISNSFKYAFSHRNEGIISINIHKLNKGEVFLLISDNGRGLPYNIDFKTNSGTGLLLVKSLSEQLDAVMELKSDNGTTFTLKFRA